MVEVAKLTAKKTNQIKFRLAGDGPKHSELCSLINQYGLNEVFDMNGHVDNMSNFYHELDVYINTSIHEGIPMSILEAMSQGLPVIAPNVGGISEIVDDGVDGYLIENRDPQVFSEKCIELFENRELYNKMSKAAREKIEASFSARQMAEEYYKLYLKVATA